MSIINIILFGAYVLLSVLFLREFVSPKRWIEKVGIMENVYQVRRTVIVKKYLVFYAILIFITYVIFTVF